MSEKRFTYFKNPVGFGKQGIQDSENYQVFDFTISNVLDLLNELSEENEQLRKKTEMDKNDFFISEAKRMRLLAFIEDNGLRKEYFEWERRIYE